jgi:hypothetical protein
LPYRSNHANNNAAPPDARLGQGIEQVETAIVWSVIAIVVIAVVVTSRFWWPKRWTEEGEEQQAARERYRLANGWVGKCYHEIMRDGGERSCPYCGKQFPEREPRHPPAAQYPRAECLLAGHRRCVCTDRAVALVTGPASLVVALPPAFS